MTPKPSAHAAGGFFLGKHTLPNPVHTLQNHQKTTTCRFGGMTGFLCAKVQPSANLFLIFQISRIFLYLFIDFALFKMTRRTARKAKKQAKKRQKAFFYACSLKKQSPIHFL